METKLTSVVACAGPEPAQSEPTQNFTFKLKTSDGAHTISSIRPHVEEYDATITDAANDVLPRRHGSEVAKPGFCAEFYVEAQNTLHDFKSSSRAHTQYTTSECADEHTVGIGSAQNHALMHSRMSDSRILTQSPPLGDLHTGQYMSTGQPVGTQTDTFHTQTVHKQTSSGTAVDTDPNPNLQTTRDIHPDRHFREWVEGTQCTVDSVGLMAHRLHNVTPSTHNTNSHTSIRQSEGNDPTAAEWLAGSALLVVLVHTFYCMLYMLHVSQPPLSLSGRGNAVDAAREDEAIGHAVTHREDALVVRGPPLESRLQRPGRQLRCNPGSVSVL